MSVPAVLHGMRPLRESSHKTSALALGCNVRHMSATFETPIGLLDATLEHPFGPEGGRTVTRVDGCRPGSRLVMRPLPFPG